MELFGKICLWMVILMSLPGLSGCVSTPPESPAQPAVQAVQPVAETQSISPAEPGSQAPEEGQPAPAATPATGVTVECPGAEIHPVLPSIAETYDAPYEQVMAWFCSGTSFDNILIALETSQAVDVPAETLLLMILDKEWEEVWAEVGFTNPP